MNKQLLAVIAAAILLFAGGIAGALALTAGKNGDASPVHTMSDGSTMTGDAGSMQDHHSMPDGSQMSDMDMTP